MFGFFKKETKPIEKEEKKQYTTDNIIAETYRQTASKAARQTFQRQANEFLTADTAQDNAGASIKAINSYNFGMVPQGQLSWYGSQGFIGYQSCAMIAQNWLVSKACLIPAKDAIRKGYTITKNDGSNIDAKMLDEIEQLNKKYKLKQNLIEFIKFGRVYGIRIAMFKIDSTDPDYYKKPFNIDGITKGSYKGIAQIDPYWITPQLNQSAASDPSTIDFYEPTYWQINGQLIHKSHLIIFRGDEVGDILKPTYLYGGVSVPQKIYERVYAAERTANEAPQLVLTKRTKVYKTDIEVATANQMQLETVLEGYAQLADNYGVRVIGKDDEMAQLDTALGDLDTVIMTQYQLVAAVANIPATKLLGTSPKGFGASGEYEESNYREELESIQESDMMPLIIRHLDILMRSEFGKDENLSVVFNPLDSLTETEQATVNLNKAQAVQIYANLGAVDGEDIKTFLASDPKSGFAIETDDENQAD